jgi:hypothetical protein
MHGPDHSAQSFGTLTQMWEIAGIVKVVVAEIEDSLYSS